MTTQSEENLRSLTLDVIDNYRKTAKFAAQALVSTSARGIGKVDSALSKYEDKLGEMVKGKLELTQEKIAAGGSKAEVALTKAGETVKSSLTTTQGTIDNVAGKAVGTVDKLLGGASKRVAKLPPKSGKLGKMFKSSAAKSVAGIGVPGVKLLRLVTSKLADGAEQLSVKAAGAPKKAAPARKTASRTTVKSRARRAA